MEQAETGTSKPHEPNIISLKIEKNRIRNINAASIIIIIYGLGCITELKIITQLNRKSTISFNFSLQEQE